LAGEDSTTATLYSSTVAGVFSADGQGHISSGYADEFANFVGLSNNISSATKTQKVDSLGRVVFPIKFKGGGDGPKFVFYLTGNGNPALVLNSDLNFNNPNGFAVGDGLAYPAASQVALSGRYGISYAENLGGSENDASGAITANGSAQTLSGTVDTNFFFAPAWDTPLTGTFQTDPVANRLTGTLANQWIASATMNVAYYMIDSNHAYLIETDGNDTGQGTLGFVTNRTPVCSACQ
jgi:hypothetical protein